MLFHSLLKKISEINPFERLILTLLFSLLPYFESRIFVSMWLYPFCYFIFFLALYMSVFRKNVFLRIISLLLFALSFLVQSFLFFYALTFFLFMYGQKARLLEALKTKKRLRGLFFFMLDLVRGNLDYFLLPFAVWILQGLIFPQFGDNTQYNVITADNILQSPVFLVKTALKTIIDLPYAMGAYLLKADVFLLPFLAGLFCILFYILKKSCIKHNSEKSGIKKNIFFLVLGVVTFILAVFPYAAVGKEIPSLFSWNNQNQLLMPLSIALIFYFSLDLVFRLIGTKIKPVVYGAFFSLVFVLLANYSITSWSEYNVNWYKQLSVVENIKANEILRDNRIFLVDDKTYELNEIKQKKRRIIYYEYMGLLDSAFPGSIKFMEKETQFNELLAGRRFLDEYYLTGGFRYANSRYNLEKFELTEPFYRVTIDYGEKQVNSILEILRLKYLQLFNLEQFKLEIADMVTIGVERVSGPGLSGS
ncbi:MAG: hypothetical protein EHM28_08165 [Spirochaetaceae bacterium]|nr:MAG: hypothetical protein EHM28_08165 [Spirochaetaceae bacterium]